jgi:hypothetical protein
MTILLAMSQPSVLFQLVEQKLGGAGALDRFVADHRATSSWRTMAADLSERTGQTVNHETLRLWYADRVTTTVTVAPPSAGAA